MTSDGSLASAGDRRALLLSVGDGGRQLVGVLVELHHFEQVPCTLAAREADTGR
ncbi:MAG TPA: hypothetical protein VLA19_01590 [Herpetosiphonaceae bacterium]|nr:hypothetical protein [Herpetosiphonaceae bacterium]